MARVEADAVRQARDAPTIRLRIAEIEFDQQEQAADGRVVTLALSIKEAVAARDALNRALNELGLPDQD